MFCGCSPEMAASIGIASIGMKDMDMPVDLSKYIPASQLALMSPLEQMSVTNRIKNYQLLTQLGKYEVFLLCLY